MATSRNFSGAHSNMEKPSGAQNRNHAESSKTQSSTMGTSGSVRGTSKRNTAPQRSFGKRPDKF